LTFELQLLRVLMDGILLLLPLLRLLFQLPLVGKKAVPRPPLAGSKRLPCGLSFISWRGAESFDFVFVSVDPF
jgi:hypothetical protein